MSWVRKAQVYENTCQKNENKEEEEIWWPQLEDLFSYTMSVKENAWLSEKPLSLSAIILLLRLHDHISQIK